MYKTMLDLHIIQQRARYEQHETDYAFRELKAVRLHTTFKNQVEARQHEANERRKRWRAYRTR